MNKFSNATCPVCGKPFSENEDVVVCPDCGAPHHRECYQQLGHCALIENHKLGKNWEPPAPAKPDFGGQAVKCPRCGADNPEDGIFCCSCGARLNAQAPGGPDNNTAAYQQRRAPFGGGNPLYGTPYADPYGGANPDEELDGVKVRDLSQFVGGNSGYFLANFMRIKQSGRPVTFNFSALFFGWKYFLYRKMYGFSLLIFLFNTLLGLPSAICLYEDLAVASGLAASYSVWFDSMMLAAQFCSILSTILSMALCLFCNWLYYRHCIRKIKKIQQTLYVSPQEYSAALAKKGRTNLFAIGFLMVLYVVFCMMMIPYLMI
ncbi:MAG: RING finger protein [Oscillospiraceae bacterium]|nr:RING finger protein [Oscillospiraceae bacterium]